MSRRGEIFRWGRRAHAVLNHVGSPMGDEVLIVGGTLAQAELEHLIHELCHAVALGLDMGPILAGRRPLAMAIEERLGEIRGGATEREIAAYIHEEAKAWAVEWEVWGLLELTKIFRWCWEEVVDGAEVQGVERGELLLLVGQPQFREQAAQVIAHIERLMAEDVAWRKVS